MVSFKDAVVICMKDKIFTFKGRDPRSEFWWFMLFDFLASIVLSMLSHSHSRSVCRVCLLGGTVYINGPRKPRSFSCADEAAPP